MNKVDYYFRDSDYAFTEQHAEEDHEEGHEEEGHEEDEHDHHTEAQPCSKTMLWNTVPSLISPMINFLRSWY